MVASPEEQAAVPFARERMRLHSSRESVLNGFILHNKIKYTKDSSGLFFQVFSTGVTNTCVCNSSAV